MENKNYTEIENLVEKLSNQIKPLIEEIGKLNIEIRSLDEPLKDFNLAQLTTHLTTTSRRHDLDQKVEIEGANRKIGTNHNGLGYVEGWSSQLSSLGATSRYSNNTSDEQRIRDILFCDEATIEITAIIKKCNQKPFMKLVKILKKYNNVKAFGIFKDENINEIKFDLGHNRELVIDLSKNYQIDFTLENKDNSHYSSGEEDISFDLDEKGKLKSQDRNDENPLLKEFSKKRYPNLTLDNLKLVCLIFNHKEKLIELIKDKRELLESVKKGYLQEKEQINELLQPLLALEKL